MNTLNLLHKYYTKESVVSMTTSYVLYYQISLGVFVYETLQDELKTAKKLEEMNLSIDPNTILLSLFQIILTHDKGNETIENFDFLLQETAIKKSLYDFLQHNQSLPNRDNFIQNMVQSIEGKRFFNTQMKMKYLSEYATMKQHYETIITDEYVQEVKNILEKNYLTEESES